MDIKRFCVCLAVLVSAPSSASTIFAPTDGSVNFLNETITFDALTQLAMFNVGDLGGTERAVVLNNSRPTAALAAFTENAGDWDVGIKENAAGAVLDSMTLSGTDSFILGLSTDGGSTWASDIGASYLGADIYRVSFADGSVVEIDVRVVPIPAAVWLFGAGLAGLVSVARRRRC